MGRIEKIDNDDCDKYGASYKCYCVAGKTNTRGIIYNWFTVHDLEEVKEILDDTEKKYLRNVIEPFRDRVVSIAKIESASYSNAEFLSFTAKSEISKGRTVSFHLLYFKKNTMYRGMEKEKKYTLEELGL